MSELDDMLRDLRALITNDDPQSRQLREVHRLLVSQAEQIKRMEGQLSHVVNQREGMWKDLNALKDALMYLDKRDPLVKEMIDEVEQSQWDELRQEGLIEREEAVRFLMVMMGDRITRELAVEIAAAMQGMGGEVELDGRAAEIFKLAMDVFIERVNQLRDGGA